MDCWNLFGVLILAFALIFIYEVNAQGIPTQKEKEQLSKFKGMVGSYLEKDFQKRDTYLLRWIRGFDGDLEKATQRLKITHEWRKEKNLDTLLDNKELYPNRKHLPFEFGGYDKEGRPYFIMSFGKWELRKYVLAGKRDIASQAYRQMIEECIQKIFKTADETGKNVDQFLLIVDLDGYTVRENLCAGCIPLTMEMATSYDAMTPVFATNLILINTPRIFQPILSLLSSTFPRPPLNALKYYDSNVVNWKKILLKQISPDQLSVKYGGKRA